MAIVDRLCAKYSTAITDERKSAAVLKSIEVTSEDNLVEEWKRQEATAQGSRDRDPTAMDIYDLKVPNGNQPLSGDVSILTAPKLPAKRMWN